MACGSDRMNVGSFVSDVELNDYEIGSLRDIKLSDYDRNAINHYIDIVGARGDVSAPTPPVFREKKKETNQEIK